jgi:hypothetical protein
MMNNHTVAAPLRDLVEDEGFYQELLQQLIRMVPLLQFNTETIQKMMNLTRNLESGLDGHVEKVIYSRCGEMTYIYSQYFDELVLMMQKKKELETVDRRAVLDLADFDTISQAPFQRLLEYRFFLRRCIQCSDRKWESLSAQTEVRTMTSRAILNLSNCIEKYSPQFGVPEDNFHKLVILENELDTSECRYSDDDQLFVSKTKLAIECISYCSISQCGRTNCQIANHFGTWNIQAIPNGWQNDLSSKRGSANESEFDQHQYCVVSVK